MKKHKFHPVAPELNPSNLPEEDLDIWKWCIRCGTLKLGWQLFIPGTKQKKNFKYAKEVSGCQPRRSTKR